MGIASNSPLTVSGINFRHCSLLRYLARTPRALILHINTTTSTSFTPTFPESSQRSHKPHNCCFGMTAISLWERNGKNCATILVLSQLGDLERLQLSQDLQQ